LLSCPSWIRHSVDRQSGFISDIFSGYVVLNGDMMDAEWGCFPLAELTERRVWPFVVCIEDGWRGREFGEVMLDRHEGGWNG